MSVAFHLHFIDDGSRATADGYVPRHASTARRLGVEAAQATGRAILLSRSHGSDLKPTLVIEPDGTCKPPAGMDSAHDNEARVCFCPACREQRKEARRA